MFASKARKKNKVGKIVLINRKLLDHWLKSTKQTQLEINSFFSSPLPRFLAPAGFLYHYWSTPAPSPLPRTTPGNPRPPVITPPLFCYLLPVVLHYSHCCDRQIRAPATTQSAPQVPPAASLPAPYTAKPASPHPLAIKYPYEYDYKRWKTSLKLI